MQGAKIGSISFESDLQFMANPELAVHHLQWLP